MDDLVANGNVHVQVPATEHLDIHSVARISTEEPVTTDICPGLEVLRVGPCPEAVDDILTLYVDDVVGELDAHNGHPVITSLVIGAQEVQGDRVTDPAIVNEDLRPKYTGVAPREYTVGAR